MEYDFTIWMTGLPCSGKTTIALELEKELKSRGINVLRLDGDVVRDGLNSDLGFSKEDRFENLRRVAHIAKLFNDNGFIVIASFITPEEDVRNMARTIVGRFKLVYLNCSLEECERRDVKGMYKKARLNKIKEFTGISSPFQLPTNPDLVVNTEIEEINESVNKILKTFFNILY